MIAIAASASETANRIFANVWPTRCFILRREEDRRVSFAKFMTSMSGAGIGIATAEDHDRPAISRYQEEK